jgi:hypothetical protein
MPDSDQASSKQIQRFIVMPELFYRVSIFKCNCHPELSLPCRREGSSCFDLGSTVWGR